MNPATGTGLPGLPGLDYHALLVLYYLSLQDALVNQKAIAAGTGLYYSTARDKVKKLEEAGLIYCVTKGRNKAVTVTERGLKAVKDWGTTTTGKRLMAELKNELAKARERKG